MKNEDVELYIMKFPNQIQDKLFEIKNLVETNYPQAKGRIAWRMPTYSIGMLDVFHFSAQRKFLSLYIGIEAMKFFEKETRGFNCTKNVVHLSFTDEIPKKLILDVIEYYLMST
jgi:Uncharacterized conserved protein